MITDSLGVGDFVSLCISWNCTYWPCKSTEKHHEIKLSLPGSALVDRGKCPRRYLHFTFFIIQYILILHSQKELAHWAVHVTVQNDACCFSSWLRCDFRTAFILSDILHIKNATWCWQWAPTVTAIISYSFYTLVSPSVVLTRISM